MRLGQVDSFLSSTIIKTLSSRVAADPDEFLVYFYCDYKQNSTHDPVNILKSLIKQLAERNEDTFTQLKDFCVNHGQKQSLEIASSPQQLGSLLQSMTRNISKVFIVVDALDECADTRPQVLEALKELYISPDGNIKALYTSRNEIDIEEALQDFKQVQIAARSSDLKLYVASEIEKRTQSRQLRIKDPDLKSYIMKQLVEQAQGMFRWAACQMDHLCEMPTDKARREALKHLPPTLFGTYERILERVNNTHNEHVKNLVEKTLRWIVNDVSRDSGKGMSTEALIEAISVSNGDICRDESAMADESDILRWCSSLVRKTSDLDGIEIAHFTVKEFLLEIDPAVTPNIARYRQYQVDAYKDLAFTSLLYMSFSDFAVTDPGTFLRVTNLPFWHHAAMYWSVYYRSSAQTDLLVELVRQFFDPSISLQFATWARYFELDGTIVRADSSEPSSEEQDMDSNLEHVKKSFQTGGKASTLHWAAALALPSLCDWLIPRCDVNRNSEVGCPLHCAVRGASKSDEDAKTIVEALLQAGADVNARSLVDEYSPLSLATKEEHLDILELLLKSGALIDKECLAEVERSMTSKRRDHDTMPSRFFNSVREENVPEAIRPLLVIIGTIRESTTTKALDLLGNARFALFDDFQVLQSEFLFAAQFGKIKDVERLLQYNESFIGVEDDEHNSALHLASKNGHVEVVKFLLGMGAAVDMPNGGGDLPIHLTLSSSENEEIFGLLAQRDANTAFHKNNNGENTFPLAAKATRVVFMKTLLELDHSREGRLSLDSDGRAVILCTLDSQSPEMLELVASSLEPQECLARTKDGETGLHLASKGLRIPAMELFLGKGVLNERDKDGATALHLIFDPDENREAQSDALRLLLQRGADVTIPNDEGKLPMHCVMESDEIWSLQTLKLLLDAKKGVAFFEPGPPTDLAPLHYLFSLSSMGEHQLEMLRYLLFEQHLDVETVNTKGQSAFLFAATRFTEYYHSSIPRFETAMLLFSQCGAKPDAVDTDGCNALHYMCQSRHDSTNEFIKKLLQLGVKIIHRNKIGLSSFDIVIQNLDDDGKKNLLLLNHPAMFTERLSILASHASSPEIQLQERQSTSERLIVYALKKGMETLISTLAEKTLDVDESYGKVAQGFSPLEAACTYACPMDAFEKLAERSSNLSRQNKFGNTLLMFASANGQVDKVRYLVSKGVDLDTQDFTGLTALHTAVRKRSDEIVEILLNAGASTSSKITANGHSVWHSVAWQRNGKILDILCERSKAFNLEATTPDGRTALLLAVHLSRIPQTEKLVRLGASCSAVDNEGMNALHYAALGGLPEMLDFILAVPNRPNLESPTSKGETAISLAASKGHMYAFKTLLQLGASPKVILNDGKTLLHIIAEAGQNMMFDIISAKDRLGSIEARDKAGYTPLLAAVRNGHQTMVEALLDKGADPKVVTPITSLNKESMGVLEWIAIGGYRNLLLLFQTRGVEFDFKNPLDPNSTPLMLAVLSGHSPVVRTLLNAGAKIDHMNPKTGWNVIHQAAFGGERSSLVEIMHYAAQNGEVLDIEARDLSGKTALMIGEEYGNGDVVDLLKDYSSGSKAEAGGMDMSFVSRLTAEVELDRELESS